MSGDEPGDSVGSTCEGISLGNTELVGPDTMNAPWGLESRFKLVQLACEFFDVGNAEANHTLIGKELTRGDHGQFPMLTVGDFLKYLEVKEAFSKAPNAFRVAQILRKMEDADLLSHGGSGNRSVARMDYQYAHYTTKVEARRKKFRFVPVLGPEFLYDLCARGLVHITGTNKDGDVAAGTGLVVHPSYILTCRHVVCDMKMDEQQEFQRHEVKAKSVYSHPQVDIALIHVEGPPLSPLQGAIFQKPFVAQTVYTLGYPKLSGLMDASVTMQHGTVTKELATSLSGDSLFLYSAISRPGNSGGPVMSDEGYVVGLSVVDVTGQYQQDERFAPHYAGIPAQVVVEAVKDLCLDIQLPFEDYE